MKKSAVITGAILCLLPLLFSFKNSLATVDSLDKLIIKVTPMENQKAIKLRMANLLKKPVRIVIQDFNGQTYYSEKVLDHNGYRQLINLKNLMSGDYILRIMHPNESRVGTLKIHPKSVEVLWNTQDLAGNYFH